MSWSYSVLCCLSDCVHTCVPGVERWLGKPRGPVTGYTTVPQLRNRLSDWLHITAEHSGLPAPPTENPHCFTASVKNIYINR